MRKRWRRSVALAAGIQPARALGMKSDSTASQSPRRATTASTRRDPYSVRVASVVTMRPPGLVRSCVRRSSRAPIVVCFVARRVGAVAGASGREAAATGANAVPISARVAAAVSDRVRGLEGMRRAHRTPGWMTRGFGRKPV